MIKNINSGFTTEYRATFEGLSLSSGSSVDSKVYNLDGSSVDSKVSLKWLVGSSVDFKVY